MGKRTCVYSTFEHRLHFGSGITCDPEIGSLVTLDHLLPFGLLATYQERVWGVWGVATFECGLIKERI